MSLHIFYHSDMFYFNPAWILDIQPSSTGKPGFRADFVVDDLTVWQGLQAYMFLLIINNVTFCGKNEFLNYINLKYNNVSWLETQIDLYGMKN